MSKRTQPPVAPMQVPHASGLFAARTASSTRSPVKSLSIRRLFEATHGPQFERCNRSNALPWHRRNHRRKTVALPQKRNARSCKLARKSVKRKTSKSKSRRKSQRRREAEAQGFGRSITPEQDPVFDPEARFRAATGGTGPARGIWPARAVWMSTFPIPSIRGSSSAWSPKPNFLLSKREGIETLFLARIGDQTGENWARTGPTRSGALSSTKFESYFSVAHSGSMAPWKSPPTVCLTNEPRCIALLHLPPIVSTTFQRRDRLRNISHKDRRSSLDSRRTG